MNGVFDRVKKMSSFDFDDSKYLVIGRDTNTNILNDNISTEKSIEYISEKRMILLNAD